MSYSLFNLYPNVSFPSNNCANKECMSVTLPYFSTWNAGDNGEITTTHLLLGLWQQEESPGHQVLASLGFSDDKAKELNSLISKPGFVDDL